MGVQLTYGSINVGAFMAHQPGSLQEAYLERLNQPRWSWQQRGPKTWKDRNCWTSLWPRGGMIGGSGNVDGDGGIGYGLCVPFEPFSCDGEGTSVSKFVRGVVVDADDVPVANARVQGFITENDRFLGEVQGNNDGSYTLAVDVPAGTLLYLVAYKPGSPDIGGTTVNTLTPTNVDGT